jgi:hypothetical protein
MLSWTPISATLVVRAILFQCLKFNSVHY